MSDIERLRILSVCDDDAIRFSRELRLQEAGYEAKWLPSNAVLNAASVCRYNVAIICQSVDWKRAARLSAELRRLNPSINILRVNSLRTEMDHGFDLNCEIIAGPAVLIQVLDSLNEKQRESCAVGYSIPRTLIPPVRNG